jgi:glycosyltransferase involved in cell wall biosynthesis
MVSITMLVHNRPALTKQAIDSLLQNTTDFTLNNAPTITVLDDASDKETADLVESYDAIGCLRLAESKGTGYARNSVIKASEILFGRGKYLYLSDNDIVALPNWLSTLIAAYEAVKPLGVKALGGYCHPYNRPTKKPPVFLGNKTIEVGLLHALGLQSMLMEWGTWDKYGPFDQTPVGRVRMSEDFAFCQKIRKDGGEVGVVLPHVVLNTSVTDSFGELVPGHELLAKEWRPEGTVVE